MAKRVLFLFGSKITNAPDVAELTTAVLNTKMWATGGGVYSRCKDAWGLHVADFSALVPNLFDRIRRHIELCVPEKRGRVTYEDIGAVVSALDKHSDYRARSPEVQPFYENLAGAMKEVILSHRGDDSSLDFGGLVRAATPWIKTVVYDELTDYSEKHPDEPHALSQFLERFISFAPSAVFATTNHDCFIEDALSRINRPVNLGFVAAENQEVFRPQRLLEDAGTKVLKLHGSIDWFGDRTIVRLRPQINPDHREPGHDSVVLIGTINKLEDYNYLVFPHLMTAFQNALYSTRRLLVSGYGLGDSGINGRLVDWLRLDPKNKMMIVHPQPEALAAGAHWHAQSHLLGRDVAQVRVIKAKFEETILPHVASQIERFLV